MLLNKVFRCALKVTKCIQNHLIITHKLEESKDDKFLNNSHNLPKVSLKGGEMGPALLPLHQSSLSALPAKFKFLEDYEYVLKIYYLYPRSRYLPVYYIKQFG